MTPRVSEGEPKSEGVCLRNGECFTIYGCQQNTTSLHSKKSSVKLTLTELISTLFQSLYSSTLSGVKLTLSK